MAHINVLIVAEGSNPEQHSLNAQPCPFCQNDEGLDLVRAPGTIKWAVVCPECHSKGPLMPSVEDAITFWNVKRGDIIIT